MCGTCSKRFISTNKLRWATNVKKKERKKLQWLREGFQPMTWQMACHAASCQLRYRAIQQFSGQVQVLAELPGIQLRRKSSWYVWCGRGAASAKCEVQVQLLNILQTWQSSHNLVRAFQEERWEIDLSPLDYNCIFSPFSFWGGEGEPPLFCILFHHFVLLHLILYNYHISVCMYR